MNPQEDKNKQNKNPEDIKTLEREMKEDFKGAKYEAVKTLYDRIIKLDPQNRLAQKLMQKTEKAKEKNDKKAKIQKAREYVDMLKKLYKEKDLIKLSALAKEFKESDPENKHAIKWERRAAELQEKLTGQPEKKPVETKPLVLGMKKEEKTGPMKIEAKTEESKHGLFGGLFKKSEEPVKTEMKTEMKKEEPVRMEIKSEPLKPAPPAPAAPIKPMVSSAPAPTSIPAPAKSVIPAAPMVAAPKAPAVPAPAPKAEITAKPAPAKEEKGNLFTKMFGKKEEEIQKKSIIDTIVAKTDKKEISKPQTASGEIPKMEKPAEEKEMAGLLTFSKVFLNFAGIFIVLSAAFLYVEWLDKDNTILSLAGISENTGERLHAAATTLEKKEQEEKDLNKDIKLYEEGYDDKAVETINKIIEERIDWPDIFAKINEVTDSVYEHNNFFKYIEYNNYSFDAKDNSIRVSGTLSDPLGRNLTKLVELEEAFKYYPKDKNDPEDTTKPYFTGFKEFTSFSKTLDRDTGRYHSSFQLSFALNE